MFIAGAGFFFLAGLHPFWVSLAGRWKKEEKILCNRQESASPRTAHRMGNAVQKEMEIALDLDEGDNLYAWAQTTLNFTAPASQRTERRYVPEFGTLFRRAVAV